MVFQNPGIIDTVNQFLLEADLGINAIKVSKETTKKEDTAKKFAGEWQHMFSTGESITLQTQHVGVDKEGSEKKLYFKLEEESDESPKRQHGFVFFIGVQSQEGSEY